MRSFATASTNALADETARDPLRNRPDLRLLMHDLALAAEPFTR
jgi:hypothetical protein